jgi:hypothetical protein
LPHLPVAFIVVVVIRQLFPFTSYTSVTAHYSLLNHTDTSIYFCFELGLTSFCRRQKRLQFDMKCSGVSFRARLPFCRR